MSIGAASSGPRLRSERLELCPPRLEDLAGLTALVTPEPMRRFLAPDVATPDAQFERLLRTAGGWALFGYGMFAIRLRGEAPPIAPNEHSALIGVCGVFHSWRGFGRGLDDVPEAGWIIADTHWGQGIAGEATRAALAWFDATHGRRRIACMIAEGNTASHRLAANLGFVEYDRFTDEEDDTPLVLYERGA